jgi:diguanylate cyclase (GGDEF)-like protein
MGFRGGIDRCAGLEGGRAGLHIAAPPPKAQVFSIDRGNESPKESLESILSSALRSDDPELDQILSALEDISEGLKTGALSPRRLDQALQRAASCALKQSLMEREIRSVAITDELTGLYNRRGFLASATHHLKLAHRNRQNALLLYCDVDDLKRINDSFGHKEGDLAILRAADALESTFRDSDIVARLGGDEFAVLASEASIPERQTIESRMANCLKTASGEESRYKLSVSIGVARYDPETPISLGALMARADENMYAHKNCQSRAAAIRHSRRPGSRGLAREVVE